ncbi:LIPS lipase, partial [Xiphorhynchus elegans]|nr:LIPS lipase [Xiphorhynchus elegans]
QPLLRSLLALCEDNLAFFTSQPSSSSSQRLCAAFQALLELGRQLGPALLHLLQVAPQFDLDPSTPGNGYWSLVQVGGFGGKW